MIRGRFHEGPTSSYNTLLQTGPDTVLVIYDRQTVSEQGVPRREIVATPFTVKSVGPFPAETGRVFSASAGEVASRSMIDSPGPLDQTPG